MRRRYSRKDHVEEKRNIKKAYFYIILSVIAVILLFFLGLPTLIKFAAFFTNLGKADKPVDVTDITPPAPPQFENFPEYSNQKTLKIEGQSEDGAIITLVFNGKDMETVASSDGGFSFDLDLLKGENTFYAKAKDQTGNESQDTTVQTIVQDSEEPDLTIDSPSNEDTFYGAGQRQVNITGTTDTDSQVYINDRFVTVSDDGSFSFTTTLSEGVNEFNIRAVDKAGNENTSTLTLNFSL